MNQKLRVTYQVWDGKSRRLIYSKTVRIESIYLDKIYKGLKQVKRVQRDCIISLQIE